MPQFECRDKFCTRHFTEPYDVAVWLTNTHKPLSVEYNDEHTALKWQYLTSDELKDYGLKYDTPMWIKVYDESNDTSDVILTEAEFVNLFI